MARTKHSEESEKSLERYLSLEVARMGGKALKYFNPTSTGWPDRIVLLPGGLCVWIELKSKGERPRPLQAHRHGSLRDMGHRVYTCDSRDKIDRMLQAEFRRAEKLRQSISGATINRHTEGGADEI